MRFTYIATVGNKYQIEPFEGHVELRKDHLDILEGKVSYLDKKHLLVDTSLKYEVGQEVSIGGYPIGGKMFYLDELSITNNPLLVNAKLIEREEYNDN